MPSELFRIFWPLEIQWRKGSSGWMIGWKSNQAAVIATCIWNTTIEDATQILQQIEISSDLPCTKSPSILGKFTCESNNESIDLIPRNPTMIPVFEESIWSQNAHLLFYRRPNTRYLQFYTLDPLELDLSKHKPTQFPMVDDSALLSSDQKQYRNALEGHARKHIIQNEWLKESLNQINTSFEVNAAIRSIIIHNRILSHRRIGAFTLFFLKMMRLLWTGLRTLILYISVVFFLLLRLLVEVVLKILNLRIRDKPLKYFSAIAQQVDLRLAQACFWPLQSTLLQWKENRTLAYRQAQYVSFYNITWLIANDIIIGIGLGAILMAHSGYIANMIMGDMKTYGLFWIQSILEWLMTTNPAGLKLNEELDNFLGQLFLYFLHYWQVVLIAVEPFMAQIIYGIGAFGVLGVSMIIACFSDLLAFGSFHVSLFYMVAAKIYYWQLSIIVSLFNLFRGKRWNALHHRLDSADYSLDQLLLGTIIFTLLVFLFPTVAVYYILFSWTRVVVVVFQAILEAALAIINHFPLFGILLRLKDPRRLPGGLQFELHGDDLVRKKKFFQFQKKEDSKTPLDTANQHAFSIYFLMKSQPIGCQSIFFQYSHLLKRLSSHYISFDMIRSLFTGEYIHRVVKLQYSPGPNDSSLRIPMEDFMKFLKSVIIPSHSQVTHHHHHHDT